MKKSNMSVLVVCASLGLSACNLGGDGQNSQGADSRVDELASLIQKNPNHSFSLYGSTLSFTSDESFQWNLKSTVRYFPSGAQEADALCGLQITGTAKYFSENGDTDLPYGWPNYGDLQLNIVNVAVLSADVSRYDEMNPPPSTVCQLYAQALINRQTIDEEVDSFTQDHIALETFDMSAPDPRAPSFYLDLTDSIGAWSAPFYLVSPASQIDVTAATLRAISGSYKSVSVYWPTDLCTEKPGLCGDTDLNIDGAAQTAVFTNHSCGLINRFAISTITTRGDALLLQGTPIETSSFAPDAPKPMGYNPDPDSTCADYSNLMAQISSDGVPLDYFITEERTLFIGKALETLQYPSKAPVLEFKR